MSAAERMEAFAAFHDQCAASFLPGSSRRAQHEQIAADIRTGLSAVPRETYDALVLTLAETQDRADALEAMREALMCARLLLDPKVSPNVCRMVDQALSDQPAKGEPS